MTVLRVLCVATYSDRPETETFIGLARAGVQLHVVSHPDAPHLWRLREAGVEVTPLAMRGRYDRRAIGVLRGLLLRRHFDVLHAFTNPTLSNSLFASRGVNIKRVAYRGIVGNLSFLDPTCYSTFLHPGVDRIVCVCDAVKAYLLDLGGFGLRLPRERPVRIYKGHDLSWYRDTPADLGKLGVQPGDFSVVMVANNRPRKGVSSLVDALRYLPAELPIRLLLVGDRMQQTALRKRIAASPRADRVHVLGYRDDAPSLSAAADVAVLPTLRREGLPRSIIEAMCYRTPPVVTASGGSPELVEHGRSGLVVPPGDPPALAGAINTLYSDRAFARTLGTAARERIRTHFSIEATVAQTQMLYQSLVAG